ncbi:helix-turn-helix domain-containing protein [Lachnotalea glycerini]|uniref:XRE family transcriptional regulator n=1 Tax=Lachnotalea glycerini TaxID=1763509 RepID=A0A371J4A8_9FIRM|nr:helix-turn-helix transcriptional regulator [Lachnotalea glycerini]RDY27507.1 XRE family transcriptional regulator [Lachnotalea glycerini]
MNTRIKDIRKTLDMSQDAFAQRIGMKGSSISLLESGGRNITEQVIKLICKEFNVNEDWLRTGAGGDDNMFLPKDMSLYLNMGKLAESDNQFKKFCVDTIMNMPDDFFDYLYKEFEKYDKKKKE